MPSQFPSPLKPDDMIGIVAPSSASPSEDLEKGITRLQQLGYRTKSAGNLTTKSHFLAGDSATRLRETLSMLNDPEVDGIFCARGGDGSIQLLPDFIDSLQSSTPKIFVGYSDITLLQLALSQRYGWVTFSGPMITTEIGTGSITRESEDHLWHLLTTPPAEWDLFPFGASEVESWRDGSASGPLLGGCLALICALLGSRHLPDFENAVLIIEDTDESPRRIDRMLHQLRLNGIYDQINGMIVGRFEGCFPDDPSEDFTLQELVMNATQDYNFPILANFPYGHQTPRRLTVPLGAPVQFSTSPVSFTLDLDG